MSYQGRHPSVQNFLFNTVTQQILNIYNIISFIQVARFYDNQQIQSYLKIPKTNIILITTLSSNKYGANDISNVVYYDDISKNEDNIINAIKPDYTIVQMEYIQKNNQILIVSPNQLIAANVYTLEIVKFLIFRNPTGVSLIQGTDLAILTTRACIFYIIDVVQFKQIYSEDACYYNYNVNSFLRYPRTQILNNGKIFITIKDDFGFQAWSLNLTTYQLQYHNYLPKPFTYTWYSDIDFYYDWNLIFLVGDYYLLSILQIGDLSLNQFTVLKQMNLMDWGNNFWNVKFIQFTEQSKQNFSLFMSDPNSLFRLDFTIIGNQLTQSIDSLTFVFATQDFPVRFQGTQYTKWYYLQENKQLLIPMDNNFSYQTYSLVFSYQDNKTIRRQFYYANGWIKIFPVNQNNINYFVSVCQCQIKVIQNTIDGDVIWYTSFPEGNIFGKENYFIQVQNYPKGFFGLMDTESISYFEIFSNQNIQSFKLSQINVTLARMSYVLTSFMDQENILWFITGLPYKDNNENFLFWMIDFKIQKAKTLFSDNLDDNLNKTCYALYSEKNHSLVGLDVLGNVYVWDSLNQYKFKYKKTITKYQCYKSVMGQLYNDGNNIYLIVLCDDHKVISFNIDTEDTQLLIQMSSDSLHINCFEDIQLIGIGESNTGSVFLFRYNQNSKNFESFFKIQTIKYNDKTINLSYLADSQQLFIQYYYSNNFLPIGMCLENVQNCLNCQMDFYFKTTETQQQDYLFGLGTSESPFLSSQNLITTFLLAQQYNQLIDGIQKININIYIHTENSLKLFQELLDIQFSNVIQLMIRSADPLKQSQINITNSLQFNQFNSLYLQNIIFYFKYLDNQIYQCGLQINNIIGIVNIDNIDYQSSNATYSQNCYSLQISNSSVTLQNLNISNKDFSQFQDIIQVSDSKQLVLDNFILENSILNSQFSIVKQLSETSITIKQMIIQNNICDIKQNANSQYVGQLFQAGQFNVSNMQIIGNQFCNSKIFSTISTINQKNYNILFDNIIIQYNKFYTITSHLFYNAIYTFNPLPQHSLQLSNIYTSDNQYLPNIQNEYTNNLSITSLILLDKIANITAKNISSKNQDQITFLRASQSQVSKLYNISCLNDQNFYQNSKKTQQMYAGCLYFIEVNQINLNLFNSSYINAVDNSVIIIQNINYKNNLIDLNNIEIFSSSFKQTLPNSYSNPLFIACDQVSNIQILNSNFYDNTLNGFVNSLTQSTTAIQIINSQGDMLIQDTQFSNSKSDSHYNFAFIQCNNTYINRCSFTNSSYDLQDNTALFIQQGGCLRIKSNTFQLYNSIFSQSTASIASFVYLEPLSNQMDNIFLNTSFSQGYSSLDGGAVYINSQNSYISLSINKCNFTDIYSLYPSSSVVSIKNQATQGQLGRLYNFTLNNALLTNILGNTDSIFFNANDADIIIQNLTSFNNMQNYDYPIQFSKILAPDNIQACTFINSENSNIKINNTNFYDLISSQESSLPLLIKSINSTILVKKLNATKCQFQPSLIDITQSKLEISQSRFNNMFQIKPQRILENNALTQQIKNNSLIQLNRSSVLINDNSFFSEIICTQNCYGSCLSLVYSNFGIQNTYFKQNKAVNGGAIAILGNNQMTNLIQSSSFFQNTAIKNGGSIYLQTDINDIFKMQIVESQFRENSVEQGNGGAFYILAQTVNSSQQQIMIQNTEISNNKAIIGGGIYNQGVNPKIEKSLISFNQALYYGNDQFSYPTQLYNVNYQSFQYQHQNQNQIIFNNFKSGDKFPKFIFELRDNSSKPVIYTEGQQIKAQIRISTKTVNSSQYYFRGNTIQQIDPIKNIFIFDDLDLIGIPNSQLIIEFISESIKIFNNQTQTFENNYTFEVHVNFRNCVYGEIINQYNNYKECQTCEDGKYSLDFEACYSCPSGGQCQNGLVNLQSGFWRKEEHSLQILQCYNRLQNCIGTSFGNNVYHQGNIGPLCEECDIHGEFWQKSYTRSSKFQCELCESIRYDFWKLALTFLWITISIFFTVKNDESFFLKRILINNIRKKSKKIQYESYKIDNLSQKDRSNKLQNSKQKILSKNYIKIFTNYVQIVSTTVSFNLNLDSYFVEVSTYLGTPIKTSIDFLECFLKDSQIQIPQIYKKLIFSLISPFIILALFAFILKFNQKFVDKSIKFKIHQLYTGSIFLFLYLQPDLVSQMISLLSCRQIGDTSYILSNINYECYTYSYKYYSLSLIVPFLIIWVIIIPFALLVYIKKNKKNLDSLFINMKFGFLYREYKSNVYYWEFIKIAQKISIILVLNLYYQNQIVKGCIITLIITGYGLYANKLQPYLEDNYNQLDSLSTKVCALTVFLCVFISGNDYNYLLIISLIIILIINIYFVITILIRVIDSKKHSLLKIFSYLKNKLLHKKEQKIEKKQINKELKKKIRRILLNYQSFSKDNKLSINLLLYNHQTSLKENSNVQMLNLFSQLDKQGKVPYNSQSSDLQSLSTLQNQIWETQSQNFIISQSKIQKLTELETKFMQFTNKIDKSQINLNKRINIQNPFHERSKIKQLDAEQQVNQDFQITERSIKKNNL
ncbi:transmembrane protein, putative (macronuclear) [Tetrahymena thermophila SB210]|uniref:Transmembrane protein, putative n=1 Tax=Tetrahymena thermophila (strain SB210) TaxID=312017 RepID=Q22UK7_TETTS|nr:transmembrane protein, putative [Tetrahymena thermophila SB210]EAR88963.3 transmembrane protein, putative [Tetrahymena thermophila SB210]|eukprot:XP_001009208.3 transmembrane protein, putative [Tetrahymena thermophila SB210]